MNFDTCNCWICKWQWDEIPLLALFLVLYLTMSSSDLPSSIEIAPLVNLFVLLQYSVSGELQTRAMNDKMDNAPCALWAVRWPCSILAIAVKTLFHGKTIFLRLFFLCCFRKKTFKTCFAFHFPALETLFLEHSKSVKITQKSQM